MGMAQAKRGAKRARGVPNLPDDVGRMRALPGQHLHDRLTGGSGQRASAAVRATCDGRPPDGAAQEPGCTRRFDRHDGTCLADDSARKGVLGCIVPTRRG